METMTQLSSLKHIDEMMLSLPRQIDEKKQTMPPTASCCEEDALEICVGTSMQPRGTTRSDDESSTAAHNFSIMPMPPVDCDCPVAVGFSPRLIRS